MAYVSVLYLDESVQFDQKQIRQLFKLLGAQDAQEVLSAALEELSLRLTRCEHLFKAADWSALGAAVAGLAKIGDQIGMQSLVSACHAVIDTIEATDPPAIAGTFFRLLRIGDRSLTDYRLLCDTAR